MAKYKGVSWESRHIGTSFIAYCSDIVSDSGVRCLVRDTRENTRNNSLVVIIVFCNYINDEIIY